MTRCWSRREFTCLAGAACLAALRPQLAQAVVKARVVVIGGGVGGATVARYLAIAAPWIAVTLVEPKRRYTTCFFSNLYLAGLRSFASLTHDYQRLSQRYGINLVHERAMAIDVEAHSVRLSSGGRLPYDRLVVAPGIAFRAGAIEGYDEDASLIMPHAWMAGPQTRLLRRQLQAMEEGGVFVLVAPPDPFRCPPGPYERASLVAAYFKRHNPRAKIIILDAKDNFFEQDLFQDAWNRHCPGMIEWLPAQFTGGIKAVDPKHRVIETAHGSFNASVANVIPAQTAGRLALDADLADSSGWCPIDPDSFESTRHRGIHLVGDAISSGQMPKSAFATNSQAKVCAFAIAAALSGSTHPAPKLFNTCYTYLAPDDAVSDAIVLRPENGTIRISDVVLSSVEESAAIRAQAVRQAEDWYVAFTRDVFG